MPKYRLRAEFGFAGTDMDYGEFEYENEEEASKGAHAAACEQVCAWAELVEDDEE